MIQKAETNVYDHKRSKKEVILLNLFTLYYVVTLAIKLITGHFIKFCRNGEIPWQQVNSVEQLEIPRPVENCGPKN